MHSTMRHGLNPKGLIHCGIVLRDVKFMHTFIVRKNLKKELLIGLDMLQVHNLGCYQTESGHMFPHQGTNGFINSIDIAVSEPQLQTIGNIEVPAHLVVTIPTKNLVYVLQTNHVYMKNTLMTY